MGVTMIFAIVVVLVALAFISKTVCVVPQQEVWVVERLGKFHATMIAGLHFIIPMVDVIRYRHSLKEFAIDIPAQACITRDNVSVHVDGVLFFRVVDPAKASYGISDPEMAVIQLAQTTLRSEIGKIDLDRTFEEREKVNNGVIMAIDQATDPWGVKVLRYEIKSIMPPKDVLDAMEKQMRAEREKRAKILESEGDRDSKINRSEGVKQEVIKNSEADKTKQINEAEGRASAISAIARANADGIRQVAEALNMAGGADAARLKVAEEYVKQMGNIALDARSIIVPANMADPSGMIAAAMEVWDKVKTTQSTGPRLQ